MSSRILPQLRSLLWFFLLEQRLDNSWTYQPQGNTDRSKSLYTGLLTLHLPVAIQICRKQNLPKNWYYNWIHVTSKFGYRKNLIGNIRLYNKYMIYIIEVQSIENTFRHRNTGNDNIVHTRTFLSITLGCPDIGGYQLINIIYAKFIATAE